MHSFPHCLSIKRSFILSSSLSVFLHRLPSLVLPFFYLRVFALLSLSSFSLYFLLRFNWKSNFFLFSRFLKPSFPSYSLSLFSPFRSHFFLFSFSLLYYVYYLYSSILYSLCRHFLRRDNFDNYLPFTQFRFLAKNST